MAKLLRIFRAVVRIRPVMGEVVSQDLEIIVEQADLLIRSTSDVGIDVGNGGKNVGIDVGKENEENQGVSDFDAGCVGKDVGKDADLAGKIIELIMAEPNITMEEMAVKLDVTRRTIEREIKKLRESDCIEREGGRKIGYWKVIKKE